MASELIVNATDFSFESDVLKADGPVLVDYWAPWCGPCKMVAPILDEIAGEYGNAISPLFVRPTFTVQTCFPVSASTARIVLSHPPR